MAGGDDGQLRTVVASELDSNEGLELCLNRRVYWSKVEPVADPWVINEKIRHAFSNVSALPFSGIIIQFWAPTEGLLSTCGQPFALGPLNRSLCKYRSLSTKYKYKYSSSSINHDDDDVINDGLVANAFNKLLPQVVVDLRAYRNNPLVDKALDSDFTTCLMLPVILYPPIYQQQTHPICVGVVECFCMKPSHLLVIFNDLKRALEGVGLAISHIIEQESYLHKTVSNIKPPITEIQEALQLVCESHDLTIGQVWIPLQSRSYLVETNRPQTVLVKLIGYRADPHSDNDPFSHIKCFFDNCNVLPLEFVQGIVEKTLRSYIPHLCSNIFNPSRSTSDNGLLPALLSANTRCSSLVIAMKSPGHTGFDDYLFEFLWPKSRNHVIVSDSLVSSLIKSLPSFALVSCSVSSGKLLVIDVTGTGIQTLRIPLSQKQVETTITGVKRKFSEISPHQDQGSEEDLDEDDFDDEDQVVLVLFEEQVTLFLFPAVSVNLADVKEKIIQDFELDPARTCCYSLEYQVDDGMWLILHDDDDLVSCISLSRSTNKTHIKLRCLSTN